MDRAIISRTEKEAKEHAILQNLDTSFQKIDELPFDFERRRMSVIVKDENEAVSLVTKGALEEMLAISTHVEYQGQISPLTDDIRVEILKEVDQLNQQGLRVLGEMCIRDSISPILSYYSVIHFLHRTIIL